MSFKSYSDEKIVPGLIERKYANGRLVFRSFVYVGGSQILQTFEEITRTEAKRLHEIRRVEAAKPGKQKITDRLLSDVKEECYAYMRSELRREGKNTGTVDGYETHWKTRIETLPIAQKKLSQIDRGEALRFLRAIRTYEGLSTWTLNGTVSALRTVLRFARENEYMDPSYDPFTGIARKEFPAQKTQASFEARVLDRSEITRLLAAARSEEFRAMSDTDYSNMVVVNLLEGQRASETCGVRWGGVDLVDRVFHTTAQLRRDATIETADTTSLKAGEGRANRMHPESYAALLAQLEIEQTKSLGNESDFAFTNAVGRPITRHRLYAAVRRAAKIAGLSDVGPQVLRRTFCTATAHAGISSVEAAAMTGHTVATYERSYAKPIRTAQQMDENAQALNAYLGIEPLQEAA